MSSIVNKIKDAVHSDSHKSTNTSGVSEGTAGPHNSRIANAADPRVDSDLDGSNNMGARRVGQENMYGTSTTTGGGYTGGTTGGTTGFSDNTVGSGLRRSGDPAFNEGVMGTTGYNSGTTGTTGYNSGTTGTGTTGRVADSNFGGGAGSGITGMTGTHGDSTGTHGPHNSRLANAADPRVDSDRDGRAAVGAGAPGPAPNTAGPHKNDMLNKVDPRVDSDLDGSKTMGGNKTFQ